MVTSICRMRWCRPLSPPALRPLKAFDTQPDRAHSSPSEIPVTPSSLGITSMQAARSQAAQSKGQDSNFGSIEPDSGLLRHAGSSSALPEPSGVRKLPPESGASGSRALQAGINSELGSIPGEKSSTAYKPGYREGSNAQPAPWPHDVGSDGNPVAAARQVSRAHRLQHELHRKHAQLAVRHVVLMLVMLACLHFLQIQTSASRWSEEPDTGLCRARQSEQRGSDRFEVSGALCRKPRETSSTHGPLACETGCQSREHTAYRRSRALCMQWPWPEQLTAAWHTALATLEP